MKTRQIVSVHLKAFNQPSSRTRSEKRKFVIQVLKKMIKMMIFGGFVIVLVLSVFGASGARLTDEFSVGTSLNKYLWSPSKSEVDEEFPKHDGEKRPTKWLNAGLGKRFLTTK